MPQTSSLPFGHHHKDHEQFFDAVVNSLPAAFYLFKNNGQRLAWNSYFERELGYSADELADIPLLGLIAQEDREAVNAAFQETFSSGSSRVEAVVITKGGERRNFSLMGSRVSIDGEHHLAGMAVDITEGRLAEAENRRLLAEMKERVKELTTLHLTTQILQKEESTIAELLTELVNILPQGWQFPEIAAARITFGELDISSVRFRGSKWSQVADFRAAEVYGSIEVAYLSEPPRVDRSASTFLFEEERLIRTVAEMLESALERRHVRNELRESQRRFSETLTHLEMIAVMVDMQGNLTFCNDFFLKLTGWEWSEVIGRNWLDVFVPEEEMLQVGEVLRMIAQDKQVFTRIENTIVTKYGQKRKVRWTNTTLKDLAGEVIGVAALGDDMTERISLQEQLRQAQRLESVGRLASGIAHDFNNMLTAILGYSELTIQKLPPGDPLIENIEEIKKAAERSTRLTQQLLAFSRKQVLQPKVVDLNEIVLSVRKMLHSVIGADIELTTQLDTELWNTIADPGQLEQVILNLIVNARDAMPDGGRITLETSNTILDDAYASEHIVVSAGEYLLLAVTDTGDGMDSETIKYIFEPFFTTKEPDEGTGLGLATVYGIVKQSGGYIWVYSEVGSGTTFKIYLPKLQTDDVRKVESDVTLPLHGSETILFIEDELAVREITMNFLKSLGYEVITAETEAQATAICADHPIDLLITDVVMPRISGPKMAAALLLMYPNLKVLYISGYPNEAIVLHGILESGVDFLQKPFAPVSLAQTVREILDR